MESKFALDYVASVITKNHLETEVHTYTYGFAMKHKQQINRIVKGATLITHSSGAMVIGRGASPNRAIFISPSQPISRLKLITRALVKTLYHSWKIATFDERRKLLRIVGGNLTELLVHPVNNLGPYVRGQVSSFDLRKVLPRHPVAAQTRIVISKHDEMFRESENMLNDMEQHGVEIVHLDAMHDEIFIDTVKVIKAALSQ